MASQYFFLTIFAFLILSGSCSANIGGNLTGIDPILNFCSRWQHQSTVKDDMLYVDGGVQTFRLDNHEYTNGSDVGNFLGVNEWVLRTWMNESWYWKSNITQEKFPKTTNPNNGLGAFNGTIRGAFWQGTASDSRIYTFGGTTFHGNKSFDGWTEIQSSGTPLWSLDTKTNEWNTYATNLDESPNYGASAEAPDQNLGFYLNGQIDAGSRFTLQSLGNNTRNLPGMVIVDMKNQTAVNISTPGLDGSTWPRIGGQLSYVPSVGGRGILVAMGGAHGNSESPGPFESQTLSTFDEVSIFDIASYADNLASNGTWYTQKTSGSIPEPRIDTCTVVVSAPDNSSHQIFMYGGRNPFGSSTILYDDIYVLSIPSFTWTFVIGGQSPRWGHTCHVVGNRQMLTVGGSLNTTTDHCDWEYRGVAIFDLSTLIWGMYFTTPYPTYTVSPKLTQVLGGTENGSATLVTPSSGWNTPALAAVMSATRTPIPTPTSSSSTATNLPANKSSKLPKGAIIGIAIGVVVLVSILVATIVMYFRIRRLRLSRAPRTTLVESAGLERGELKGDEKQPIEVPDNKELRFEMMAEHGASEASPVSSTTGRAELGGTWDLMEQGLIAELSGEVVPRGGRLGVPRIETSEVNGEESLRSSRSDASEESNGDSGNGDDERNWVGDKKEEGVESPAQDIMRPIEREFPTFEELKDIKKDQA